MSPRLRPSVAADLPTVVAWEADPDTAFWLGDTGLGWHERALADPAQEHLFAEEADEPVGFVVLAGVGTTDVELRRLVVAPARRGGGHGRALLRAALGHAAWRGAAGVWLDVKPGNERARALYAAEGFTETGAVGSLVIMRRDR